MNFGNLSTEKMNFGNLSTEKMNFGNGTIVI